jgi:hypothetical protein
VYQVQRDQIKCAGFTALKELQRIKCFKTLLFDPKMQQQQILLSTQTHASHKDFV